MRGHSGSLGAGQRLKRRSEFVVFEHASALPSSGWLALALDGTGPRWHWQIARVFHLALQSVTHDLLLRHLHPANGPLLLGLTMQIPRGQICSGPICASWRWPSRWPAARSRHNSWPRAFDGQISIGAMERRSAGRAGPAARCHRHETHRRCEQRLVAATCIGRGSHLRAGVIAQIHRG